MVFTERKPKFRARKLDLNKSIPVYRFDQAVDLDDYGSPLRTVAQVATGVDKEEEDEHHLQAALTASTSASHTYYIPTPEAHPAPSDYERLYPKKFKQTKQFIKWSGKTLEDLTADLPHYDADEEDAKEAEADKVAIDTFEWIIEAFEDTAHKLSQSAVSLEVLERYKNQRKMPDAKACERILEYWILKRSRFQRSLISVLRHEDLTNKIGADPYVCFRRREIKAPRKTRRTDAQCMDKLRKLHYDLATSKALLEASLKRDKYKKESLVVETQLFEAYWSMEVWKKQAGRPEDWALPDLPSFRAASQSVLEPKKKKSRPSAGDPTPSSSQPQRTGPVQSLLKSTKYFKPYYPIEVLRQIQKDMELIMVDEASRLDDLTADLHDDEERAAFVKVEQQPRKFGGIPCFSRFRIGRAGMVQLDRKPIHSPAESRPRMDYAGAARVRLLNARDCSHLHNAFVGNYNQHYIQTTNHINLPLSYNAWVAATAPIVQQALGNKTGKANASNAGSPKKTTGVKRGHGEDGGPESVVPDSSSAMETRSMSTDQQIGTQPLTQSQPPAGLASLSGNSQITVKVKSRPPS